MIRDYEIIDGIYLRKSGGDIDLHNNLNFVGFSYSVKERTVIVNWERSSGDWVSSDTPESLSIEFLNVSELRFLPRSPEAPYSEDDCINSIGYWADEDWAKGVVLCEPEHEPEPHWPVAIDFMSGAVIILKAEHSNAKLSA